MTPRTDVRDEVGGNEVGMLLQPPIDILPPYRGSVAKLRSADCRNDSPRLNQDDHAGNGTGEDAHAVHHAGAANA